MTPLTPAARAAIHDAARRRADALRDAAIDDLLRRIGRRLRSFVAAAPAPLPAPKVPSCRS